LASVAPLRRWKVTARRIFAWNAARVMLLDRTSEELAMTRIVSVALCSVLALAACVPKPAPQPEPPRPQPQPPVVRPVPSTPPANWVDAPLTPGAWSYRSVAGGSEASFGGGAEPLFVIRCDAGRRQVSLARPGAGVTDYLMQLTTTYGTRNLTVSQEREPRMAVAATLPAADRQLDAIAFSRGRFMVEVPGLPRLIIPAWPEPARVVEDCR